MRRFLMVTALVGLAVLALFPVQLGCDDDGGGTSGDTDSDTDADSDTDTETDTDFICDEPISGYGTTDLDYNTTPLVNPRDNLPLLEGTSPAYTPALAAQTLPDTSVSIHNLQGATSFLVYADEATLATDLRQNGVARQVSVSNDELMAESLTEVAETWTADPAVLLTSDAVFNTFHNFYDNLLLGVEVRTLRPRVMAMLGAVKAEAAKRFNSLPNGPTREAALDVVAYLMVAEKLMEPETPVIGEVCVDVEAEVDMVDAFAGLNGSAIFDRPDESIAPCVNCEPCASDPDNDGCGWYEDDVVIPCPERFCEDYSQYKPRGHYTYNEELEQYFRSVMWLGRMTFLNRSDQSTRGAVILVDSLKDAQAEIGDETVPATQIWKQFFRVIGTFVGSMDDLNASEIDAAVLQAMGGPFSLDALDDAATLQGIHEEIDELRDPEILSGMLHAQAEMGKATKGLRLAGQIFLPDSYAFGQTVFANVGPSDAFPEYESSLLVCGIAAGTDPDLLSVEDIACVCDHAWDQCWMQGPDCYYWPFCRGFPSGLDVAAVLGSPLGAQLAEELFGSYGHYNDNLDELIAEFEAYDLEQWGTSVAWTWLYALEGMFAEVDPGAPAFMRTGAWETKVLETGLTSWAELRHDTILYAKQSYTSGDTDTDGDVDGDADLDFDYVEPQPEAYARLGAATDRLLGLAEEESLFLGEAAEIAGYVDGLVAFLETAETISIKELEGEALTDGDISWIRGTGETIGYIENGLLDCLGLYDEDEEEADPDRLKTTIIADVHTWLRKTKVLEVGSGYLDHVAVLHQLPTGEWGVAVGPAFTYHEFEWDMDDRLTDEEWREILEEDPDCGHPDWLDW